MVGWSEEALVGRKMAIKVALIEVIAGLLQANSTNDKCERRRTHLGPANDSVDGDWTPELLEAGTSLPKKCLKAAILFVIFLLKGTSRRFSGDSRLR